MYVIVGKPSFEKSIYEDTRLPIISILIYAIFVSVHLAVGETI